MATAHGAAAREPETAPEEQAQPAWSSLDAGQLDLMTTADRSIPMKNEKRKSPTSGVLVVTPAALKQEIVRRVAAEESNMNDLAVAALARRHNVRFRPSGRRGEPSAESCTVVLRMPDALKRRLQLAALKTRTNLSYTIIVGLCESFNLEAGKGVPVRRSPFGGGARVHRAAWHQTR